MKLAIFILCLPFIFSPKYAISGYFPWGWNGWLQSVATITDAPTGGVLLGSVVFAQDTDALYYWDGSEWTELSGGGGGSGTVTSVSVVSANGFAGTVADATTTPAITMETSITGLLHGNGTAVAAETVSSPLNESSGTLSCLTASGSQAGCLSSTDWSTFNGKQASGNYITALTGDVSASGPGSAAATLATVNSDVGSYVCSDVTVNGKGLVTAAASGTSSDIIGLFSGCSGTDYLGADGACHTAAGTPGGSSSDVQYNSSGSFGGDSGMTYDGSGDLTLTGKVNATTALLSNLTASEAVVTDGSKNLASLPYSTTPGASTLAEWDANSNLSANSFLSGYTTTATAAGTTTLTVSSAQQQFFTGTTTQTIVLPVTSTLVLGQEFTIVNNSTGTLTVESSGANSISTVPGGATGYYTCVLTSGTTASSWSGSVWSNSALNYPTFSVNTSTTAATTTSPFIYSVTANDSAGGYNASTGQYTIPAGHGGMWHFSATAYTNSSAFYTLNDGATTICQSPVGASTVVANLGCDCVVAAGDVIALFPSANETATGTAYDNQFSGFQIITSQAQPIGNITSSGSGQYHAESVYFAGASSSSACSSSTCTIYFGGTNSWVSSVSRSGTGSYTINVNSGVFSATPVCQVTPADISAAGIGLYQPSGSSSTSLKVFLESSVGTTADDAASVTCTGPH